MAFTRDDLRNLGIEDETVDKVMALHGKEVQNLKDQANDYKSKVDYANEEINSYKKRIEEKESELTDLQKKAKNGDDLSETLEALKQANKEKDEQHKKEMEKLKLNYEISKALNVAGARNERAVLALIDTDNLKLSNESDNVIGLDEQLKNLKETDGYLFNSDNTQQNNEESQTNNNNYNAGSSQGNTGKEDDESAIGRNNAKRLFGNK